MAWERRNKDRRNNNNNTNNRIDNKVTLLIVLWILDKVAMAFMFLFFK